MRYINGFWSIIILVGVLFISGCDSTDKIIDYHVGTEGLVLEYSDANPESIYEGEQFSVISFIRNDGAYSLPPGNPAIVKITYDNYRIDALNGNDIDITEIHEIHGRSSNYPEGDEASINANFMAKPLTHLREGAETYVNYELCYPYATTLSIMTCIDTTAANREQRAVSCKSEDYNGIGGQGGPIVITRIEPEIMLQKDYVRPQFKIYIENFGEGYVSSADTCDGASITDSKTSGFVKVTAKISGSNGIKLECGVNNNGVLRLVDSESFIRCNLPKDMDKYSIQQKNYLTPLEVNVSYIYYIFDEAKITINRNELNEFEAGQGMCNTYELEDNEGNCVNKCTYCVNNPESSHCNENKPNNNFEFVEGFSCSCSLSVCDTKIGMGNCIKSYCPGTTYCCNNKKCEDYQVLYNGECEDRCDYCSEHSDDKYNCGIISTNTTNFRCTAISLEKCLEYGKYNACFKNHCGDEANGEYCVNEELYTAKTAKITPTT